VGKLISVSFVFSNNIWVVCSQLLSVEGILFCNGSQNAFGEPWFVKGALFFFRFTAIWSMRIKSIIKNFFPFTIFTNSSLRVITSSASGLRLVSLSYIITKFNKYRKKIVIVIGIWYDDGFGYSDLDRVMF